MVALGIFLDFVSLLRDAGLLDIYRQGLTWIVGSNELSDPTRIPRRHSGVMLLVPIRKTCQLRHTWVTVKGGHVTRLLARHVK